jgi:hypothetical protein
VLYQFDSLPRWNANIEVIDELKDDPRFLVLHDHSLLLTYATMTKENRHQQFNTVILTINASTGNAQFGENIELTHPESGLAQKNWSVSLLSCSWWWWISHRILNNRVPLEYRQKVYYIQRINPLVIVRPDDNDSSPSVREAKTVFKGEKLNLPWPVSNLSLETHCLQLIMLLFVGLSF